MLVFLPWETNEVREGTRTTLTAPPDFAMLPTPKKLRACCWFAASLARLGLAYQSGSGLLTVTVQKYLQQRCIPHFFFLLVGTPNYARALGRVLGLYYAGQHTTREQPSHAIHWHALSALRAAYRYHVIF